MLKHFLTELFVRILKKVTLRDFEFVRHPYFLLPVALIFTVFTGCGGSGPALFPVQGTVTVGGKPTEGVIVTFAPTDGRIASSGRTNSKGKFALLSPSGRAGAVSGKHKVMLALEGGSDSQGGNFSDPAVRERLGKQRDSQIKSGKKGAPATPAEMKTASIPSDYSNPQKTPLEYEVKQSSNEFDVPVP